MNRYLALVFFVFGVNCGKNDDPGKKFYELSDIPKSHFPVEYEIENSLDKIPESSYQKGKEFLTNILSDLKSYPAKNSIRQHVENATTVMAFFEQARRESNVEGNTIIKRKMKQFRPQFDEGLAKIGQSVKVRGLLRSWEQEKIEQLQNTHNDLLIKSMRELDSSIVAKIKSYCNEAIKEMKESGITLDNVVLRHISKAKVMIDVLEATGGETPSNELLKAKPWIAAALESFRPQVLREMVYLAEFAKLIRK